MKLFSKGSKESKSPKETKAEDFSNDSLNSKVHSMALNNPLTWLVGAIGGGCILFGGIADMTVVIVAGGVAALISGGAYVINAFTRKETLLLKYMNEVNRQMRERNEEIKENLKEELEKFGCSLGAVQLAKLDVKFESFVGMLDRKLNNGELTYSRFLNIVQQVYFNVLDNLKRIVESLDSISAIDPGYLKTQIKEYERRRSSGSESIIAKLTKNLDKYNNIQKEVSTLLDKNVEALAAIDDITTEINEMKTQAGQANLGLEAAMSKVARLADGVKDYNAQD